MGCGGSVPVAASPEPDAVDARTETLHSWTMEVLPGVPNTPNRALHDRQIRRLERYMNGLTRAPQSLDQAVEEKRAAHDKRKRMCRQLRRQVLDTSDSSDRSLTSMPS